MLLAADNSPNATLIPVYEDGGPTNANREIIGPIPVAAIAQNVKIEWRYTGNGDHTFNGAYPDDVVVTESAP